MPANSTLSINLSSAADDDLNLDYVLVEQKQEERRMDLGTTSKNQGIIDLGTLLFGGVIRDRCVEPYFKTIVYAYPSRIDLNFSFNISHPNSTFGLGIVTILSREEVIQCNLQDSIKVKYPVISVQFMEWVGNCYDTAGNVIARPTVTQNGRVLSLSQKVYGSLRVRYSIYRYTYGVTIRPLLDDSNVSGYAAQNRFDCAAYCTWNGGVSWCDILVPVGLEEAICAGPGALGFGGGGGGGGDLIVNKPGHGTYPVAVSADRKTTVDYCSQLVMSDIITEHVETASFRIDPDDQ